MGKKDLAEKYFHEGYACSQAVLMAFADEIGLDLETAKKISSTFGSDMGRLRKTCGALTAAFMVIGLKYGNTSPDDLQTKLAAYDMVRELAKKFVEKYGTTECSELLKKYSVKSSGNGKEQHKIICLPFVIDAVTILEELIDKKKF